ncbi:MAG: hypothetical protein IH866_02860, partial [Chloroflexi bacterium]|nr:hypothetical protein [Chloroflexota bacterium]
MRSLTPVQLLIFGAALAAALFLALFPVFPRQLRVREDDIASRTIYSPRDLEFESALLTEQARQDAADAVPDVLVFDPSVREAQLATLAATASTVAGVRGNEALDDAAKRTELLAIVSRPSTDTILSLSDEGWRRVQGEAGRTLNDALSQSIRADGAQDVRDDLLQQISPDLAADEANLVADLLRPLIVPTLVVDQGATQEARTQARDSVGPFTQSVSENDVIVLEGERIDANAVELLEHVGLLQPTLTWENLTSVLMIALLAAFLLALYIWRFPTPAITSLRNLLLLALLIALPVLVAKSYFSLVLPDVRGRFLATFLP